MAMTVLTKVIRGASGPTTLRYEVYSQDDGSYRWRLKRGHKIICDSAPEGLSSLADVQNEISVVKHSNSAGIFEVSL